MMKEALLALLLLSVLVAIGSAQMACPPATAMRVKVYNVFDGDTISIKGGERVRLLGIDTPETGEPYADLAKQFTRNLVQYKVVCLEFDTNQRDPYGRLLAYVYVETDQGLVFVNAELVKAGLARLLFIPPNYRYRYQFEALLHEATIARRGMWGEVPDILTLSQLEADPVKYVTEVVTVRFLVSRYVVTDDNVTLYPGDNNTVFCVTIDSDSLGPTTGTEIDPQFDWRGKWVEVTGTLECKDVRLGLVIEVELMDQIVIEEGGDG